MMFERLIRMARTASTLRHFELMVMECKRLGITLPPFTTPIWSLRKAPDPRSGLMWGPELFSGEGWQRKAHARDAFRGALDEEDAMLIESRLIPVGRTWLAREGKRIVEMGSHQPITATQRNLW